MAGEVARRIVTFPPLIALILALLLRSVGRQLRLGVLRGRFAPVACGLGVKLLLAPLALALIYLKLLGATGTVAHVTLFEAAMGPQIGGAIVATRYELDPPLVTLMVGIGSVAAFLTLPMWWYALQAL